MAPLAPGLLSTTNVVPGSDALRGIGELARELIGAAARRERHDQRHQRRKGRRRRLGVGSAACARCGQGAKPW